MFFSKSRIALVFFFAAALCLSGLLVSSVLAGTDLPPEKIQEIGQKMYRDGVLPSGDPIKAFVSDDVPVDGTAFTCVSCHLHSGMGSIEGEVITPPTNGRILYEPREPFIKGYEHVPSFSNYAKYLPVRPAYTDQTLAELIQGGVDPTGRSVLHVMPRYDIYGEDMDILIAYLKTLSDQPSPGVSKEQIKFATVIVEGTDPKAVKSMLDPIQFGIDRKNALAVAAGNNDRVARMGYNMLGPDLMAKKFTLSHWILKGAPETWRAQLEDYYQNEPVFALLGGISEGDWAPVHQFCEDMHLPNLFPVVDYPVLSDTDWYTLYLSRGVRQEGEAAARYLMSIQSLLKDGAILQVYRDNPRGQALADGFREIWNTAGNTAAIEATLTPGEKLTKTQLQQLINKHKPVAVIVWDDESALPALTEVAAGESHPNFFVASATWLDQSIYSVPEPLRGFLYMTYPYRLPQEEARFKTLLNKVLQGKSIALYDEKIFKKGYITNQMIGDALMEMRSEYYRDFLLDSIGMMEDTYLPLYERLTFGPGQRYASKGCFIVQLSDGDKPKLERRSEWIIK
ncbi:ABC transporter substrate-binding protein [Pelobacter seleniigenes]|uniref:ABC transporter substrate-binding protein n=1 Tax=Pelobacter seleniigenes TaxID=407188 RepID=UPI0004A6DE30|nr:ABC transporter substrate-binding protein [Pelobacter seleniigenes]